MYAICRALNRRCPDQVLPTPKRAHAGQSPGIVTHGSVWKGYVRHDWHGEVNFNFCVTDVAAEGNK